MSRNTTISRMSTKSRFKLDQDPTSYKLKEVPKLETVYLDEKDEIFSDDSAFERDSEDGDNEPDEGEHNDIELSDHHSHKGSGDKNLFTECIEFDDF